VTAAFELARAAAAVAFAFHADPGTAAWEATYEAWHALDPPDRLITLVRTLT
jgi:hypothetical protein